MITVLIVDDNLVIRKGLRHVLEEAGEITIAGEAQTSEEAIEWMKKSPADIVLMDIRMPGIGGIKATARIMRLRPQTKVLAFSITDSPYTLARTILAGAKGCLGHASLSAKQIIHAIRSLASGESIPLPPSVELALAELAVNTDHTLDEEAVIDELTPRQREIFELVADGKSNSEIAGSLRLEEKTVKNHVHNIYTRLRINNRYEAITFKLRKWGSKA